MLEYDGSFRHDVTLKNIQRTSNRGASKYETPVVELEG